jgi:hypothetical protein
MPDASAAGPQLSVKCYGWQSPRPPFLDAGFPSVQKWRSRGLVEVRTGGEMGISATSTRPRDLHFWTLGNPASKNGGRGDCHP